jgi:hypothetical protein
VSTQDTKVNYTWGSTVRTGFPLEYMLAYRRSCMPRRSAAGFAQLQDAGMPPRRSAPPRDSLMHVAVNAQLRCIWRRITMPKMSWAQDRPRSKNKRRSGEKKAGKARCVGEGGFGGVEASAGTRVWRFPYTPQAQQTSGVSPEPNERQANRWDRGEVGSSRFNGRFHLRSSVGQHCRAPTPTFRGLGRVEVPLPATRWQPRSSDNTSPLRREVNGT